MEVFPSTSTEHDYVVEDSEYYVCCFSKDQDSLPMWNYYSKGKKYEGYNIKFSRRFFNQYHSKVKLYNIIYDKNEQKAIIENALLKLLDIYKDDQNIQEFKHYLSFFLKNRALSFKKECFKHENEVRLVMAVSRKANKDIPINYRISNGMFVPYVELEFDKSYVHEITIGPLIHSKVAQNTLNEYLFQNKYYTTSIKPSEIPVRF